MARAAVVSQGVRMHRGTAGSSAGSYGAAGEHEAGRRAGDGVAEVEGERWIRGDEGGRGRDQGRHDGRALDIGEQMWAGQFFNDEKWHFLHFLSS